MSKQKDSWDSAENEASNNFVSWGKIGDFLYGTLVGIREVKSTLPGKEGTKQKIYDVKVKECLYHNLDEKKNPLETAEEPKAGEMVSVGDRSFISTRMAKVKLGQVFGLKFVEELPAKIKSYSATKVIKVFTPKNAAGELEMDTEWLEEREKESEVA